MIAAERSDWNVLLDNRRFTVQEPEPLNMTDSEIVYFIATSCLGVVWAGHGNGWWVTVDDGHRVSGDSFHAAIGKAFAYHKEANE